MEYLSKTIVQDTPFAIQDFNLQTDYVAIANNGVLAIDFSFLDNIFDKYDLILKAVVKLKVKAYISQAKNIKVFYYEDDQLNKHYVDYGPLGAIQNSSFLSFDISSFLFTKLYTYKTLYIENNSGSEIRLTTSNDNLFTVTYYKSDQLNSNTNIVSDTLLDYSYNYNYVSKRLLVSKTLLDNQLFFPMSLVYSNLMANRIHSFFACGWNLNVFEYLIFDNNGAPTTYVDQNNCPHTLVALNNAINYYYTNDGSALILKKSYQTGNIAQYKLYHEHSTSSYKRFDKNGRLEYYYDNTYRYFYITYTNSKAVVWDCNGNKVIVAKITGGVEIKLNGTVIYTLTHSSSLLTSLSNGANNDTFTYSNKELLNVNFGNGHHLNFARGGANVLSISYLFNQKLLDFKSFEYDYLKTHITDRHNVTTFYQFDENINLFSSGEKSSDDVYLYASDNQKLIGENIGDIFNALKREYKGLGEQTIFYVNTSSDNEQYTNIEGPNQFYQRFQIKAGHRYAVMAAFEKFTDAVLDNSRYVKIQFVNLQLPSSSNVFCTLEFDPYLKRQVAVKIVESPFDEASNSPLYCSIISEGMYSFGGGAVVSNICIVELKNEASASYWVNGINDPYETHENIDSLDWIKFSYSSFRPSPSSPLVLSYTYRDLIRNYINVELNLPFFWDSDHRRLIYREDSGNTGGFPIDGNNNVPGNNCIYGKKTISKYVNINNEDVPLFDFEYLTSSIDSGSGEKRFYKYSIKQLGNEIYKTVKIYDSNFNIIKEEDVETGISISNTYDSNHRLIETKKLSLSSNDQYNKETISFDYYKRISSISNLATISFESTEYNYLNNFELISKITSPLSVETNYQYSSDYKNKIGVNINNNSNHATYSNDVISSYSNNTDTFSFSNGEYGYNDTFVFPNSICQSSVLSLDTSGDVVGYVDAVDSKHYVKRFNKYGNVKFVSEKRVNDSDYLNQATFLYFETKPNDINNITTQNIEVKSNFKLYKVLDSYCNRNIYYDYDDDNKLIQLIIKSSSNNQIYSFDYSYDDLKKLSQVSFVINSTYKIDNNFTYQDLFSDFIENIQLCVSGFLTTGNVINESITRDAFSRIESIIRYNNNNSNSARRFKEMYYYNTCSMSSGNPPTTNSYTNDLVNRVDYYQALSSSPSTYNFVRAEYISYDNEGKIIGIAHGTQSGATSNTGSIYEYDDYGRLVLETNYDYGEEIEYSYDSNGNIISVVSTNLNSQVTSTINFAYDTTYGDKLVKYNSNANNVTYDSNLNITSIGNSVSYSWVRGRLLASANVNGKTNSFTYDYDGTRVEKIDDNGFTHTYYLDGHKIIGEKVSNSLTTSYIAYLYGQNGIFGLLYNNNFYYLEKNILGDITRIYLGSSLVARYIYDAYGNHKVVDANGVEITDQTNIGHINPFRYRGYYYDKDIDLYYCNARYYSPKLRRWISVDRHQYLDFDHIGGLNLYSYCRNNPIMYRDEEGTFLVSLGLFLGLLGASFAIGFTASLISQGLSNGWENLSWKSVLQASIDGMFAAASLALSYTSIGIIGSIISGEILGGIQYYADSELNNSFSIPGLLYSSFCGAMFGLLGKGGAQYNLIEKLDVSGKSAYKAISTAFYKYGNSIALKATINLWKSRFVDAVTKLFVDSFKINVFNVLCSSFGIDIVEWVFEK